MTRSALAAGLGLLLLPRLAQAQDCADLVDAVDRITEALAMVELERAQALADEAISQLECQTEPVNTVMLAGLFQLSGAVALYAGEPADADAGFARAVAISPTTPIDSVYGEDVEKAFQDTQRRVLAETGGSLLLQGSAEAWLDGRSVQLGLPVDVVVGHHLLQWREEGGDLQARDIRVASMETRQLTLGEVNEDQLRDQQRQAKAGTDQGMGTTQLAMLAGGGGAVVVGGVLLGLASGTHARFLEAEDPDQLESLQSRNHALALSGLGLMVAGAGTAGASFFIDGGPGLRVGLRF
jgi:hypothetical protein